MQTRTHDMNRDWIVCNISFLWTWILNMLPGANIKNSSPFMFTRSNMGWVFAAHLQEGLSPTSTLWCPAFFYFTFLCHCQNEYPLMGFLAFITCNTRWIWIVSLTTNLHLDSASKMPSHYSFHLPSTHFAIFHTVLKTTPLILKITDGCGTTKWVPS